MLRRFLILLFSAVPMLVANPARSGSVEDRGVGIHIAEVPQANPCAPAGLNSIWDADRATNSLSTPNGPFFNVYVLGCNFPDSVGIGGIEFGVDYDGAYAPGGGASPISVFDWTLCADLQFRSPTWPAPGSGNLITWTQANCLPAAPQPPFVFMKVAGYFYMAAYDVSTLTLTPRPISGLVKVANCDGAEHDVTMRPEHAFFQGTAGFRTGGWQGCSTIPLPVEPTTWGHLKNQFGR